MLKQFGNTSVKLIGDPHLGRVFKTGVPLHRVGEREAMVWKSFEAALNETSIINVCVGDIFDKFIVPPEVVLRTAMLYRAACKANPGRPYILLRGNHDASRDSDKASSFDLLCELLSDVENMHIVKDQPYAFNFYGDRFGFLPWHPFISSAEMADLLVGEFTACFGHWDIEHFGGSDHNLIPVASLGVRSGFLVSGHIHQPGEHSLEGCRVLVTGSLQPYSHAEDVTGELYVTLPYEAVKKTVNPDIFRHKNLRVLVAPGQVVDWEIDCLSLTTKNVESIEDAENIEVDYDNFDFKVLFSAVMDEHGVSETTRAQVWDRYSEVKIA